MSERPPTHEARRCACANIRRTDRVVTGFYDERLAPSGLSTTQFTLLSTLAEAAPISINRLAEIIEMDRTTLTRNLTLLVKRGLACLEEGEDRRMRLILLTPEGEQALGRAWPLWQDAQARIEHAFGQQRFDDLLTELSAIRAIAR